MSCEKLAVSTITFARNEKEENLILEGLSSLSAKKVPSIFVVDGGSRKEFLEQLKTIPKIFLISSLGDGLQNQIAESLKKAKESGAPFIFYTESNKAWFFKEKADEFIEKALNLAEKDPAFGMAIASRTPESFSTFPPFQRYEESVVNKLIADFGGLEQNGDYTYGPRIISSSLIPYLDRISGDLGWGWMSFLLIVGKRLGKNIHTVSLDLPCPPDEQKETEKDKVYRLKQFKNQVDAIYQAVTIQSTTL